ncbi:MAG: hypothetical protein AB7F88_00220 [Pyrinomonadaceae bacterium]
MKIIRGIAAILAGFVFVAATHTVTDLVLESLGIFTPPTVRFDATWMVLTATAYRALFMVAGGYLTAALAPDPKMRYVLILAVIGTIMAIVAAVTVIPMDLSPAWYPIALALLGFPCTWLGGWLRTKGD